MASSSYNFIVSAVGPRFISSSLFKDLGEITDYGKINWDDYLPIMYNPENKGKDKHFIGINEHTCRETLLSWANRAATALSFIEPTMYKYTTFIYHREGGKALQKEKMDKIARLGAVYQHKNITFGTATYQGRQSVTLTTPHEPENYYYISLLFYIFRNEDILDWILANITPSPYANILSHLQKEFLLKPEWGDSANNHIFLSIYCYLHITTSATVMQYNGPVNYAKKISVLTAIPYLQTVYCRLLQELGENFPERSLLDIYGDTKPLKILLNSVYKKPRKKSIKKEDIVIAESEV